MYTAEELEILWSLSITGNEPDHATSSQLKNFLHSLTPEDDILDNIIDHTALITFFQTFSGKILESFATQYACDSFYLDRVWFPPSQEVRNKLIFAASPHKWTSVWDDIFGEESDMVIPEVVFGALYENSSSLTKVFLIHLQHIPTEILDETFLSYTDVDTLETLLRKHTTPMKYISGIGEELIKHYRGKRSKLNRMFNEYGEEALLKVTRSFTAHHGVHTRTLLQLVENCDNVLTDSVVNNNICTHPNLPSELRLHMWNRNVEKFDDGEIFDALNMLIWCSLPKDTVIGFINDNITPTHFLLPKTDNMGIDIYSVYLWCSRMAGTSIFNSEELYALYQKMSTCYEGNFDAPLFYITYNLLSNPKTPKRVASDFLQKLPRYVEISKSSTRLSPQNKYNPIPIERLKGLAEEKLQQW